MITLYHTSTIVSVECCKCGMPLGLSKTWMDSAIDQGGFKQKFFCPYCGTKQGWGVSNHELEVAKLEREKESLAKSLKFERERRQQATAEAEHFRRSRDGMKGAITKIKKRIGGGVCPCCNRHFSALQKHMATKHPDFQPEDDYSAPALGNAENSN